MHKFLRCIADIYFKLRVNIKFFRDFVKRLLASYKRQGRSNRSAILVYLFACSPLFSAFEDINTSTRSSALGGAGVSLSMGAESALINPATMLCSADRYDSYLFYAKPYNMAELHHGVVAVRFSNKKYALGGVVQHFGNSLYGENQFICAGALRVVDGIALGANVRYAALTIKGYGKAASMLLDVGAVARLHPKAFWGIAIKNTNFAEIGKANEPLPQIFSTGLSVQVTSDFLLAADVYKDTRHPVDGRAGFEYTPISVLSLRIGFGSIPARISAGFSININWIHINYAFKSHMDLGATHLFSIRFIK